MGFSYAQAVSIGLGHLHPAVAGGRAAEQQLVNLYAPAVPAPKSRAPRDGLNKTERRFRDEVLEPAWVRGDLLDYGAHRVKLRLTEDVGRLYYTPDFLAIERPGEQGIAPRWVFIEIKGYLRDDAAVKVKVAADQFRCARWLVVYREKWGWDVREVGSDGIGREPVMVPWILGI